MDGSLSNINNRWIPLLSYELYRYAIKSPQIKVNSDDDKMAHRLIHPIDYDVYYSDDK